MRVRLYLIAALLWSGCSSFSAEDVPERGFHVGVLPNPVVRCGDPTFEPLCGISYEFTLTAIEYLQHGPPPYEAMLLRLEFDDSAQVFDLTEISNGELPVEIGKKYRVDVRLVPTPVIGYGSIEIRDADGLVFYATTEVRMDSEWNPEPPEGWYAATNDVGYKSHGIGCGVRSTPQVVVVEHKGAKARLVQGEKKRIGTFEVSLLIAEEVDYSSVNCLDFIAPELSYMITRVVPS